MPVSAEGRVEHQKINQVAALLLPGWVFGVQLSLQQPQVLNKTETIRRGKLPPAILLFSSKLLLNTNIADGTFLLLNVFVLISACVCRRASWTPKLNQVAALLLPGWVFGVQLDYSCLLKSVSATAGNRVVAQFFLVNRAEHQKLKQPTREFPFSWAFGVQLGLWHTKELITMYYIPLVSYLVPCS